MLDNKKCILVYGLHEEELDKLKKADLKIIEITSEMADMKVRDILEGIRLLNYINELPKEKLILFNNYDTEALREKVKYIRTIVKGGILASVTPTTNEWTFKYLLNHLIEERDWFIGKEKGR